MKDIEELIKVKKYKNTTVQQRFNSKKNTVAHVLLKGKPRVLKWFAPGFKKQMETEYSILKNGSAKLNIPPPYEMDTKNNVLITSLITGENLCDVINDGKIESTEKQRLIMFLSEWFAEFHTHFKKADQFRIRGDSILRNFLITDRIWGVDFEESRMGKPVEDIAGMCVSILSTDPMFTEEKFTLCQLFIETYHKSVKWNLECINDEIAYVLLEKIQWRPDQEETLRKYSQAIRKKGLL